ncbi:MAG TPA: N-acetyl-gamma-glutamyl-phosphate reductase [Candidatus Thermoplasmatota archaeon]|nr:N-acetyl-gamma-glutamyl-phosphate reductase [Candidatus Thermoplasmatota archaeon]
MSLRVGIVGASGYGGGELLRLALRHPEIEVAYVTSNKFAGRKVKEVHPNLRSSDLTFHRHEDALTKNVDAVFLAGPHGTSAPLITSYMKTAERVFDLSADFRLRDVSKYARYYSGWQHPHPELLASRAYGIAELHREEIKGARLVSGAGCIATTSILSLAPLARSGLLAEGAPVIVDAKVGSSAAGAEHSAATHHPERRDVVRAYAPTGHRHEAEILQETGLRAGLTCHAIELVRGILATSHVWVKPGTTEKDVWKAFRAAYGNEPFVRIVKERTGLYRYPEPKLTAGTNEFHVGFELDEETNRLVVLGALDNLVKGTAGAALQNFNIAFGLPETRGLELQGLHP